MSTYSILDKLRNIHPGWGLSIILIGFTLCRLPALHLPLFWDELGVDAPSVFELMENGVDIQPKALDPELSRGHPMLYVFVNALIGSLFGENLVTLHVFNLLISLCVLVSTFFLGRLLFGTMTGLLGAFLLALQPIMHAQATLILPEVSLSLAAIWMLYGYWSNNRLIYVMAGVCAVWLKETAIFIPAALILYELSTLVKSNQTITSRSFISRLFWIGTPWLAFGGFLILQKIQNGWFLFPYHTGLFDLSPGSIFKKLILYLQFLLVNQGRFLWLFWLVIGFVFAYLNRERNKPISEFLLSPVYQMAISYIGILVLFSSTNAYLNRYLLLVFPVLAILVAEQIAQIYLTWKNSPGLKALSMVTSLALLAVIPWLLPVKHFVYDEHPVFERQLILTQAVVDELVQNPEYNGCNIQCNWPIQDALKMDYAGYREEILPFYLLGPGDHLDFQIWMMPGSTSNPPPPDQTEIVKVMEYEGMSCTIFRRK